MHTHLDFELGKERAVEMHREVERNRLQSLLAEAHHAKDAVHEEFGPPRRGMGARAMAVVMALYR